MLVESAQVRAVSADIIGVEQSEVHEVPTGLALEKARRRVGFSVDAAASSLGISVSALGDYESGMRTPSKDVIADMCRLYGVEAGRVASRPWVPRVPPRYDGDTDLLWIGWTSISVKEKNNEHLLRAAAAALRDMRSLTDDSPVVLRSAELPLLSTLFDLNDEGLEDLLVRYLKIQPADALQIISEMVVLAAVKS